MITGSIMSALSVRPIVVKWIGYPVNPVLFFFSELNEAGLGIKAFKGIE